MTLEQIAASKQEGLDTIGEDFGKKVDKSQEELLAILLLLLSRLSYDTEGNLVSSTDNYARVEALMAEFKDAVSRSSYYDALVFLANRIDKQADLTKEYYKKLGLDPGLASEVGYEEQMASMFDDLTNLETNLYAYIRNFILASIASGSARSLLEGGVGDIMVGGGPDKKGRLFNMAVLTADTMFAVIDRSFTYALGKALGIKKFRYAGGLVNDSRPFCVARDGKVFDEGAIRSWGRLGDWKGKIPGTDEATIFVYLGGYRCRHWLVPQV
jgi:hypothetical protein